MNRFLITSSEYTPALLSGFLLTMSFPKFDLHWLAWVAMVPLMLSLYRLNEKQAFNGGLIMGLSHFLSLLYWIVPTISIYGELSLFLALPILILLAGYLALYPALFAYGIRYFHSGLMAKHNTDPTVIAQTSLSKNISKKLMPHRSDKGKFLPPEHSIPDKSIQDKSMPDWLLPLTAAVLWVGLEYIRSNFLTGFPWGAAGYSQYMQLNLIQIADITSVYGISFIIILTNGVVTLAWRGCFASDRERRSTRDVILWTLSLLALFGGVISYGKMRIATIEKISAKSDSSDISVVQGNIDQIVKWNEAYQESTITQYCNLSMQAAQHHPDLIIWPETALPFYYSWNKKMSDKVDSCIMDAGTTFLIGSPAFRTVDEAAKSYNIFNRAYMINKLGVVTGSYDKVHLVPFGEYVPFGRYLSFLGKIIAQAGDFSSGKKDTEPLAFNGSSVGVLICFEIIFPHLSRTVVNNGAQILVTMTNDAWFGYTSAPGQHFTTSVFRAIENRRAVARAANTGISGFIDPTGKILQVSKLFEECSLTQKIPSLKIKTVYSMVGDLFAYICLFAIGVACMVNIVKKKVHSSKKQNQEN